ncbi:hypothetical protein AVEN_29510-1 [Araneus ventricosus]|uniref:Uncharacterized protein n=1 Tax=Araneus ventricosus TaxID=182803 RepID=A0A4Y2SHX4_ARAVE|nr:hypothetical protein AVEN_29510-1 [Araneus ventricosus]
MSTPGTALRLMSLAKEPRYVGNLPFGVEAMSRSQLNRVLRPGKTENMILPLSSPNVYGKCLEGYCGRMNKMEVKNVGLEGFAKCYNVYLLEKDVETFIRESDTCGPVKAEDFKSPTIAGISEFVGDRYPFYVCWDIEEKFP